MAKTGGGLGILSAAAAMHTRRPSPSNVASMNSEVFSVKNASRSKIPSQSKEKAANINHSNDSYVQTATEASAAAHSNQQRFVPWPTNLNSESAVSPALRMSMPLGM